MDKTAGPDKSRRNRRSRYLPYAAEADAALLERPLTDQQRDDLLTWVFTAAQSAGGVEKVVETHAVPLKADAWRDLLEDTPAVLQAATDTGRVSRQDVAAVAAACSNGGLWTPLLNASYAWGQGRNGYGPIRLSAIHAGAAATGIDIETALSEAVNRMSAGSAVDGYTRLQGAIPDLGPAFFTKFLYFAGAQIQPALGPAPLVLDAVVAGRLAALATARASAAGLPDPAGLSSWVWSSSGWSPHRYGVWLDFAQAATRQLAPTPSEDHHWPGRADLVELAIFRGMVT